MAEINMPASPAEGSTYKAENGVTYIWDGEKWSATNAGTAEAGGIAVSASPPTVKESGTLWYNTVDGILYVWYEDATSSQWVDIRPGNDSDDA